MLDLLTVAVTVGGAVAGFFWRTQTKRSIQGIILAGVIATPILFGVHYAGEASASTSVEGAFGVIGSVVLDVIGLFFYALSGFQGGKWIGGQYLKVQEDGHLPL